MVDVILKDPAGVPRKHTVNAISGDMFKHILVGHLIEEARASGAGICKGCEVFDPNRICADREFMGSKDYDADTKDSLILAGVLKRCAIDDCAGILITGKIGKERSIARKSSVEFGWVVGRPELTTTDSYFHAKYVPEGRGKGSGEGENLGQNIFHRPASSGMYAVTVNVDLYRVGRNDITLKQDLDKKEAQNRSGALLRSVISTFIKPTGAHRNTQNPHVVEFEGVIATSTTTVPAPAVSALNPSYRQEIGRIKNALNTLGPSRGGLETREFGSLAEFAEAMAALTKQVVE
jgi:CRISPR-associated protein Cst2